MTSRRTFLGYSALAAAAVPAAQALAQAVQATGSVTQSGLVGKLEGPTPAGGPKPAKFSEAPQLAELVKAGKLPSVDKRVPDEPMVVKPVDSTGKYGGYNPHTRRSLPRTRLARYAAVLGDAQLERIASPEIFWDPIVAI